MCSHISKICNELVKHLYSTFTFLEKLSQRAPAVEWLWTLANDYETSHCCEFESHRDQKKNTREVAVQVAYKRSAVLTCSLPQPLKLQKWPNDPVCWCDENPQNKNRYYTINRKLLYSWVFASHCTNNYVYPRVIERMILTIMLSHSDCNQRQLYYLE